MEAKNLREWILLFESRTGTAVNAPTTRGDLISLAKMLSEELRLKQ